MAQIPFRANTQSSSFPLLSRQASQTIIATDIDQTYVPNINPADSTSPVERGVPQILYGHNIMPSTYGYQSVGYLKIYDGIGGDVHIDEVMLIISRDKVRTYLAVDYTNSKTVYVLNSAGKWQIPTRAPTGNLNPDRKVSVANINGESVILIPGVGPFYYQHNNTSLNNRPLAGLSAGTIQGLLSSNGYLIAWSTTGYHWSAVNDPYDFVPDEITGAGGGDVQDASGPITHCQPTTLGFMIYTTNNVVGVMYSGNSDYPFNAKAISAAGGVKNKDFVCPEASSSQYAYTTNGIQQIAHSGGTTVLPSVTDFLAGQIIEDFDDDTQEFIVNELSGPMKKKFALVCDRYLVCSYGPYNSDVMTHAIVVDIIQSRMGKLRINHTTCFEHRNTVPEQDDTPRRSIGFANKSGETYILDFNTTSANSNGTVIYGKYQVVRGEFTDIQRIEAENIPDDACELTLLATYDGKNFKVKSKPVLDTSKSEGLIKSYHCNLTAKNISLLFQGQFEINGLVMFFNLAGDN